MLSLLLGSLALAAPAGAPARTADAEELRARALFKEAQLAYDVGRFEEALTKYSDAYTLKPLPGFLFNIAQCHRNLSHFKEAAFFYGRFIDNSKPEGSDVQRARELLAEMNQAQADKEAKDAEAAAIAQREKELKAPPDAPVAVSLTPVAQELPPAPPPVEPEVPLYKKGVFWGVVIGAAAVIAAGTVTAVVLTSQTPADMRPRPTLGEINGTGQL